ncbi:MAG: hypothetical protein R2809_08975 [Flavobacteriales bacterium]
MENLFLIALLTSAFILLLILMYRMFQSWLALQERRWMFQLKADNNKALSNLRLTACERVIIMLERITPTSLVMRQSMAGKTSSALQLELLKSVREEFELNVSLQMYVSENTWNDISDAKEYVVELIRLASTKVEPASPAINLSRYIFDIEAVEGNTKIKRALTSIRKEIESRY